MSLRSVFITIVALVAVFGVTFAFTEPAQPPPSGNVPAPINVGNEPQTKSGSINAVGGLFDGGVKVCRTDGANCPGSLTGRPTVLRYENPPHGSVLGPADICVLESFGETRSEDRDWCLLTKNGDLYSVIRRTANCTFVCLRW